jgi:FixJ family two-component response regulator
MPHVLGREVATRIVELRPNVRVLFVSGYAQPVLGSKGTLDPGVALLEKPFTESALLLKVRAAIDEPPS